MKNRISFFCLFLFLFISCPLTTIPDTLMEALVYINNQSDKDIEVISIREEINLFQELPLVIEKGRNTRLLRLYNKNNKNDTTVTMTCKIDSVLYELETIEKKDKSIYRITFLNNLEDSFINLSDSEEKRKLIMNKKEDD